MSFDGEGGDRTVFVGGVSPKATEEGLKQFFESNFGEVDSTKIIYDRSTGRSKGYGFVTFRDADTADRVRNSSGLVFLGKVLNIGNAYRRHARRYSGGGYNAEPTESSASPVSSSGDFSGGYGGYPVYAYNPYYGSYWPQVPTTSGEAAAMGQATPEQIQAYQAQLQAMMQAQMAMWQQMQQSPAAMQQLASQFQAMSVSHQPPPHPPVTYAVQQPQLQHHPQVQPQIHTPPPAAPIPSPSTIEKSSNGNGKSESPKTE